MPTIQHKIKEIIPGTVKSGYSQGKEYRTIVTTSNARLTAFEEDFWRGLEPGKYYDFTYEQSGKFLNLSAPPVPVIQVEDEITTVTGEATGGTTEVKEMDYGDRERMYKNRISALQATVNYIGDCMAGTHSDDDLNSTFQKFLKLIEKGE